MDLYWEQFKTPFLCFAGYSGVGKTTLIGFLIKKFHTENVRTGYYKHDSHRFQMDKEGKDTWPQEDHTLIWDARSRDTFGSDDQTNRSRSIYDEGLMAFGKPDVIRMADGSFLVGFWCTSNFVMHLRYARLSL